jgi:hypothetical protein
VEFDREQLETLLRAAFDKGRLSAFPEADDTPDVVKSWDESLHPRGDDGKFINKGEINAAAKDPAKAAELRGRVTDPGERKKLNAAITDHQTRKQFKTPAGFGEGLRGGKAKPSADPFSREPHATGPHDAHPKPNRPTVHETVASLRSARESGFGPGELSDAAEMLGTHTADELQEIKRQLGIRATGRKAELANKILLAAAGVGYAEEGFTGRQYAKDGTLRHYEDGQLVHIEKASEHDRDLRVTVEQAHALIDGHIRNGTVLTDEGKREIARTLHYGMTIRDIDELKRRLGLKAAGRRKELYAQRIADLVSDRERTARMSPDHPSGKPDPLGQFGSLEERLRHVESLQARYGANGVHPDRMATVHDAADRLKRAIESPFASFSPESARDEVKGSVNDLYSGAEYAAAAAAAGIPLTHKGEGTPLQRLSAAVHELAKAKQGIPDDAGGPDGPKNYVDNLGGVGVDRSHVLRGDTFANKDYLKEIGAKWNKDLAVWSVPEGSLSMLPPGVTANRLEDDPVLNPARRQPVAGNGLTDPDLSARSKPSDHTHRVVGNTYPVRGAIKRAGGRWDGTHGHWTIDEDGAKLLPEGVTAEPIPGRVAAKKAGWEPSLNSKPPLVTDPDRVAELEADTAKRDADLSALKAPKDGVDVGGLIESQHERERKKADEAEQYTRDREAQRAKWQQESQERNRGKVGLDPNATPPAEMGHPEGHIHNALAKRFGIPPEAVRDVLDTDVSELRRRDKATDQIRSNTATPTTNHEKFPHGSAKINAYQSDEKEAYVDYMTKFDPKKLKQTESEDGIKKTDHYQNYLDWARQGSEPPPLHVYDSTDGKGDLVTTNRRRSLAAAEAGLESVPAWHGPLNKETGNPLKYGDIHAAANELRAKTAQSPAPQSAPPEPLPPVSPDGVPPAPVTPVEPPAEGERAAKLPTVVADPDHAATRAILESKMAEAKEGEGNKANGKGDRESWARHHDELEDQYHALTGRVRTLAEHEKQVARAKSRKDEGRLAVLAKQEAAVHAKHLDDHLAKLDKRIAKEDESHTWANHVLQNHGKIKWDSEMETVYGSVKDAIENGMSPKMFAYGPAVEAAIKAGIPRRSFGPAAAKRNGVLPPDERAQSIDQIAQAMESAGTLSTPSHRNSTDYLLEKISCGETHDGSHDDNRQALAAERSGLHAERDGTPEADKRLVESMRDGKKPKAAKTPKPADPAPESSSVAMDNPNAPEGESKPFDMDAAMKFMAGGKPADGPKSTGPTDLFGRPLPKTYASPKGDQLSLDDHIGTVWVDKAKEHAESLGGKVEKLGHDWTFHTNGKKYQVGPAGEGYPVTEVGGSAKGPVQPKPIEKMADDEYLQHLSKKFMEKVESGESGYKPGSVKIGKDGVMRLWQGKTNGGWSKPAFFEPAWTQAAYDTGLPHPMSRMRVDPDAPDTATTHGKASAVPIGVTDKSDYESQGKGVRKSVQSPVYELIL